MVDDYRPTHYLGLCMLTAAPQLYGTATWHPSSSPSLYCLSVASAAFHPYSLCVCSPRGILLSFCISLSPSVSLHPVSFSSRPLPHPFVSHSNSQFIYIPSFFIFLPQMCLFLFPIAVVLWFLPHSQPGPERLWILLQDQRAEKEVAGAVWHGHVSVFCVRVCAFMRDAVIRLSCVLSRHHSAHIFHPVIQVRLVYDVWGDSLPASGVYQPVLILNWIQINWTNGTNWCQAWIMEV